MTAPMSDPDYKRLDLKLTALLFITSAILLVLLLVVVGVIDLVN